MAPIGKLLCLVLSSGLVLGALEIGLRHFDPFPSYESETIGAYPDRYDPVLGWAGISSLRKEFVLPDFKIQIATNRRGFRDGEFEPKLAASAREGTARVLFLGDSFAWGWGVEQAARVSEVLERLVPGITTFNLAQSGYGTDQEYLVFEAHREAIDPDVVIVMFSPNDFEDCAKVVRYERPKPMFAVREEGLVVRNLPVPFDEAFWAMNERLTEVYGVHRFEAYEDFQAGLPAPSAAAPASRLLERVHTVNWLRHRLDLIGLGDARPQSASRRLTRRKLMRVVKLLEAIQARTAAMDGRMLVALIPEKLQAVGADPSREWQDLLLEACRRRGLACLDLLPAFEASPGRTYWRRDPHWNPGGHRLAAETIADLLSEELPWVRRG